MKKTRQVVSFLFLSIVVGFSVANFARSATYILSPEDHSVQIDQKTPNENLVNKAGMVVASEITENARMVIHFDLSQWAPDSISQAKLYLYHYRGGNFTGFRNYSLYSLASAFDESTATWNSPWTMPGGDYDSSLSATAAVPEELNNWVFWDVTGILKNRFSNITNYGFLIRDPIENSPGPDGPYVRFYSHRCLDDVDTANDFPPYLEIITEGTNVEDKDQESGCLDFSLSQNFPNPFNHKTLLEFTLSRTAQISLVIFNIRGERVKTLLEQEKPAGTYTVEWDGTNQCGESVSSGIYFYQMRADGFSETKRLLFLK